MKRNILLILAISLTLSACVYRVGAAGGSGGVAVGVGTGVAF